jgi:hypothetical protein
MKNVYQIFVGIPENKGPLVRLINSFSCSPQLEHRAPFGVSVITHTIRHTVGLLWTSDQPVAEASTYTGQHNI